MSRRQFGMALLTMVTTLMFGCTFVDLANYSVPECASDPSDQTHDDCDHLNVGDLSSCAPWQCDPSTRHCARRLRDGDKDGGPARQCGGRDCDDRERAAHGARLGPPLVV